MKMIYAEFSLIHVLLYVCIFIWCAAHTRAEARDGCKGTFSIALCFESLPPTPELTYLLDYLASEPHGSIALLLFSVGILGLSSLVNLFMCHKDFSMHLSNCGTPSENHCTVTKLGNPWQYNATSIFHSPHSIPVRRKRSTLTTVKYSSLEYSDVHTAWALVSRTGLSLRIHRWEFLG